MRGVPAGVAKRNPNAKTNNGKLYDNHDRFRPTHASHLRVRWECGEMLACGHGTSMPAGDGPARPLLKKVDWS